MLFQEGPAQTTGYLIAGYAVIFGVMLVYLISLILRGRNLQQDLQILRDLDKPEGDPGLTL
ncbi:MAG: hypothetical protein AB1894_10905 [Chloroflexota bacterium]